MSLFIRCEWLSAQGDSLESRIHAVAALVSGEKFSAQLGSCWYRLANSKGAALEQPVDPAALANPRKWRKASLAPGETVYRATLWNGKDHPQSANVSISLYMPPNEPDMLVISLAESDEPHSDAEWQDVLSLCEAIASSLGGLVTVSSDALVSQAADLKVTKSDATAYAAFWGIDRSSSNPRYHELKNRGHGAPYASIACQSWNEVRSPRAKKLQDIARLLA